MKLQKREGTVERTILTAMIVDKWVLGRLAGKWTKEGLFSANTSNLVGGWCVHYHQKYNKAPGKAIESMFASWAEHADKDSVKQVEKFLSGLSGAYSRLRKKINRDFVLDQAGEYFNEVAVEKLKEGLEGDIANGKLSDAQKRVHKFKAVEIGVGAGIDLLQDKAGIGKVLEGKKNNVLVKYPGGLGRLFRNSLERDGFIAFMAIEKAGKSFWLIDMAWRAMCQRRKVAVFQVGDLSEDQIRARFYTRAVGRPLGRTRSDRPVRYPKSLTVEDEVPEVDLEVREYDEAVKDSEVWRAMKKVMHTKVKDTEPYLKLSVHPMSSITVAQIRGILREWELQDWMPDVVIVDYADILAKPAGYQGESRDAINENWMALRRMSQELHCLVVTATQVKGSAYSKDNIDMSDYSEDKRKYAHVTGMVAINSTDTDKKKQIQRLGWVVLREDDFLVTDRCYVAGCLAIANPAIRSV